MKKYDETSGRALTLSDFKIGDGDVLHCIPDQRDGAEGNRLFVYTEHGKKYTTWYSDHLVEHVKWHVFDLTGIPPQNQVIKQHDV